jgi:hypothetical protein
MKTIFMTALSLLVLSSYVAGESQWKKHVIYEGERANVAV